MQPATGPMHGPLGGTMSLGPMPVKPKPAIRPRKSSSLAPVLPSKLGPESNSKRPISTPRLTMEAGLASATKHYSVKPTTLG